MKTKSNIKLNLSERERKALRTREIRISDIPEYAADELQGLLGLSEERARELRALADFQRIPSIGIAFARDLYFMGFDDVNALKGKDGASLTDAYERKKAYRTDPCVEDQFRLAAYVATSGDYSKKWWDFTAERKAYRTSRGYPSDRPKKSWYEVSD